MNGTPISVELELKAYKNSTEEIATLLDTSAQLDSMDVIMLKVNQKLTSLRTQLGAVMQTQLDELTESLHIVHSILENTNVMNNRFDAVRKNCKESLHTLGTNKQIDKLYLARKNVYSVVNQTKFMEELPDRIKTMTARLNEDYTCLKIIYDEWIGYYAWMWRVKEQISHIEDPTRKLITNEIFSSCFVSITSIKSVIEEKLWEHIYRCMELSRLDPAALVRALTIIEKSQKRKEKAKGMAGKGERVSDWVLTDRDWIDECKERLLYAIQRRCEHAYNQGESMKDKLKIGMQLLSDLEIVRSQVVPCFPPHYDVLQFFVNNYATVANSNMELFYTDPTLEPGEVLVLVEWLDSFSEEVSSWGAQDIPVFINAKKRLLQKFHVVCTSRMEIWFKRILDRGDRPLESEDGHLLTAVPEDLFSLIKTQTELAGDHLKGRVLIEAIKSCLACISVYSSHLHDQMKQDSFSDRDLCALINNNNTLRENIESIADLLEDSLSEEQRVEMVTMLSGVTGPLIELNSAAAHALSELMIGDVDASNVLENMCFTDEWLYQEEADGILTMTSTFQDYFNDLKVWIQSKFFFGMIVIDALHLSVTRYFKCFGSMKSYFDESMTVGCRIKTDYDSLMSYFTSDIVGNAMKYTDRRYRNGEYIAEILQPIRNLEIFLKQPANMIVMNGVITDEGYRLLLSLVGGKLMENGIKKLLMARTDIDPEDKVIIMNKFAMFYTV